MSKKIHLAKLALYVSVSGYIRTLRVWWQLQSLHCTGSTVLPELSGSYAKLKPLLCSVLRQPYSRVAIHLSLAAASTAAVSLT